MKYRRVSIRTRRDERAIGKSKGSPNLDSLVLAGIPLLAIVPVVPGYCHLDRILSAEVEESLPKPVRSDELGRMLEKWVKAQEYDGLGGNLSPITVDAAHDAPAALRAS